MSGTKTPGIPGNFTGPHHKATSFIILTFTFATAQPDNTGVGPESPSALLNMCQHTHAAHTYHNACSVKVSSPTPYLPLVLGGTTVSNQSASLTLIDARLNDYLDEDAHMPLTHKPPTLPALDVATSMCQGLGRYRNSGR